ncbi:MAG: hypothetical protein OEV92_02410 [Nitrospinota bacterium]|nr:hypothetical protein [Nitrospinota bacterium]
MQSRHGNCLDNMYLRHVESPAIAEMARIIKPGNKLVIGDLDSHDHEFLRKIYINHNLMACSVYES